jgi:hypothetical protein
MTTDTANQYDAIADVLVSLYSDSVIADYHKRRDYNDIRVDLPDGTRIYIGPDCDPDDDDAICTGYVWAQYEIDPDGPDGDEYVIAEGGDPDVATLADVIRKAAGAS